MHELGESAIRVLESILLEYAKELKPRRVRRNSRVHEKL
jgi:hypothetical protein